ncbi:basic amino acid ABC transporter substrate-binding protein [Neisseriaceae bacterium CLB008]|nr:basic amino acid ABC transporter substrate-binding protein [Neisseriaceae bacterium]
MNLKKWLGLTVACSALALAACGGSDTKTDGAEAAKILKVGVNAEFAPFESLDANGQMQGFDIDLLNAIGQAEGVEIKFVDMPWDGLFVSLNSGDVNALAAAITTTEERKQSMDFTEPYFTITQVIAAPKDKAVATAADLEKLNKVAVVTGHTGDLVAQKILGPTSAKIVRFENIALAMKEVENGGADVAISDSAVVAHYLKNNPNQDLAIIPAEGFDEEFYGLAVRKGDADTLAMLNDGLKKVRESGEYDTIYGKYFSK